MKRNTFLLLFVLSVVPLAVGQTNNESVLFTVDNQPVYAKEFKRVYNKNLELVKDESQKDIDTYLDLFINYKLKLKAAKALKLDEKPKYKRELASYRKQLAKNYLTDSNVTEALVKEAYDRTVNEIKASHILIRLPESAPAEDTLQAYNTLIDIKNKVKNGEDFAQLAKKYSQDPSAVENGGDLGYFGGFRMVYDFENAAFSTPVGEVSQPFRTRFGYHIVKSVAMRKSEGEVTVAHIMVSNKKKSATSEDPKVRINDIYKKLQQGEKFELLAKQFSEDKASAKKGGNLNRFGKGQLSSQQFEDAAFALTKKGDVSQPIETDFGWHIIKLIGKHPVAPYEEIKNELEVKIKRDSRSKLINTAFANKLREKYNINMSAVDLKVFEAALTDDFFKRSWKVPAGFNKSKALFNVGKETITTGAFADHLVKAQRKLATKQPIATLVKEQFGDFVNASVLRYHEENLESENEEFAIVVNEYRDGLLLFDLMETQVWNAAKKDSAGLQQYYQTNSKQYVWPKRLVGTIASSSSKSVIKKVNKYFKKGFDASKIKGILNKGNKLNVIFTKDTMSASHQALPKTFQFKKGISKVYSHNDGYVVGQVSTVLESKAKTFEESRGKIVSDYQTYIEKNWLESLRKKHNVTVNNEVLEQIKKEITN